MNLREVYSDIHKATGIMTTEEIDLQALDLFNQVLQYQATDHKVAFLNRQQVRFMDRYDKVGMIYLPSYLRNSR